MRLIQADRRNGKRGTLAQMTRMNYAIAHSEEVSGSFSSVTDVQLDAFHPSRTTPALTREGSCGVILW